LSGTGLISTSAEWISVAGNSAVFTGTGLLTTTATELESVAANLSAVGLISTTATELESVISTISGVGLLTTNATHTPIGTVTIPATGLFNISENELESVTATLPAIGLLSITATELETVISTFAGIGLLTTNAIHTPAGAATLLGAGLLTTTAEWISIAGNAATFSNIGQLTVSEHVLLAATAAFSDTGLLTTTATELEQAVITISGVATVTANALPLGQQSGQATLPFVGQIIPSENVILQATSIFSDAGLLAINAIHTPNGSATLPCTGTIATSGAVAFVATSSLSGSGLLTTNATHTPSASTTFASIGNINISENVILADTALFSDIGLLVTDATIPAKTFAGSAVFSGVSSITTSATHTPIGTAIFADNGDLTTAENVALAGSIVTSGSGQIVTGTIADLAALTALVGSSQIVVDGYLITPGSTTGSATFDGFATLSTQPSLIALDRATLSGEGTCFSVSFPPISHRRLTYGESLPPRGILTILDGLWVTMLTNPTPVALPSIRSGETDGRYIDCTPDLGPLGDYIPNVNVVSLAMAREDGQPLGPLDLQPAGSQWPTTLDETGLVITFGFIAPANAPDAVYELTLKVNTTNSGRVFIRDFVIAMVSALG